LQERVQVGYPTACRAMARFIREKDVVEDLAQDVFLKLWEKRETILISTSFLAYLHRMSANEAISYLRKAKKRNEQLEIEELPPLSAPDRTDSPFLQHELHQHIQKAIGQLPDRCRMVFVLSRYEELTYKEIAEKLEISIKTVENQMGKALRLMREQLKEFL
jgi:RNA polymerase sigma-70 factor (ECF subfamily)